MNFISFLAQTPNLTPSPSATPIAPIEISPNAIPWTLAIVGLVLGFIFFFRAQYHKQRAEAGQSEPDGTGANDGFFRNEIARTLLNTSIWGLVILGGLIILLTFANNGAATEKAKVVFDSLLPVFGTWVGTLLAFYFSKANYESAAAIARGAAGGADKLRTVGVKEKMIRPDQITALPPDLQGKPDAEIPLKQVSEHLKKADRDRLPLFQGNKTSGPPARVLHLSRVDNFVSDKTLHPEPGQDPTKLTLENLLKDPAQAPVLAKSFALVKESATLADAKAAMDNVSASLGPIGNCYDVFVTTTGAETEPVLGWITNDIINENAKV